VIERARAAARPVAGWLTDAEGELLFDLAANCPPSATIVEIGSWHGKSTIWLASGARLVGGRVVAIDPHHGSFEDPAASTLAILKTNLANAGVADLVTPIVARSQDARDSVTDRYDLLFIDGDHAAAGVRRDLEVWLPGLRAGGTVALHDVVNPAWSGPRREVARLLWQSRALGRVRFVDSIAYARKVGTSTAADRIANAAAALALRAYGLRPLHMPALVARVLRWLAGFTPLKRRGSLER
jgi:predicted O-methyltransferase YrrM